MADKRKLDTSTDEEEESVSLKEIIEESEELESTANAVLGGSDDQDCTYNKGYVSRQALYACYTCVHKDSEHAGICLACSLECHDGHELFELYTKRNFRCDCGNKKYTELKCKFFPDKDDFNSKNIYNHNFKGEYCTCNRPYPDPDDSVDDEMIQCILCEDWFHSRHLLLSSPIPENYSEMICHVCMDKYKFLKFYQQDLVADSQKFVDVISVDKTEMTENSIGVKDENLEPNLTENNCNFSTNDSLSKHENNEQLNESKNQDNRSNNTPVTCTVKKITAAEIKAESKCKLQCLKNKYAKDMEVEKSTALFCQDEFRTNLCQCEKCIRMLNDFKLDYLVNISDMTSEYEKAGAGSGIKTYNKGMEALSEMDRMQQVEVLHGYNDMKSELTDYLKSLGQGKVVTENDIKTFFEQLKKKKKPRMEMSYFCK